MLNQERMRLDRIHRLKFLIETADKEREKFGHRGGMAEAQVRAKHVVAWTKEMANLLNEQRQWENAVDR